VRSLVLLEPGLIGHIPSADVVQAGMAPVVTPFLEGDAAEAVDRFARAVMGRDYKAIVEASCGPDALAQVAADADDAFAGDLTSLGAWEFDGRSASAISCPVLLILGKLSGAPVLEAFAEFGVDAKGVDMFAEMLELARSWIPHASVQELDGVNHALQMQDPDVVGTVVGAFLAEQRAVLT
jgi:pimeloyl-ACP methyl ester carboxylesterase